MNDYRYYRRTLQGLPLPLAYVDMDLLDANVQQIITTAGNTPIRVASKSVRCTHLLRYILDSSDQFSGLMTLSICESLFLAAQGFDNMVVGYPETNPHRLAELVRTNKEKQRILPMVDCPRHLQLISDEALRQQFVQPVCVDIDMSSRFPLLHFGVHRSPINSVLRFAEFLETIPLFPGVELVGMMGYEAQIAGVGDNNPHVGFLMNSVVRMLKRRSIPELTRRRQTCLQMAVDRGHPIRLVNGGGTGSIGSTVLDGSITEITVGSGFYCPGLFDYYKDFRYQPAAGYALEITRQSGDRLFTLAGGGYIASGGIGIDKRPVPFLPSGIHLFSNEGTGEVQTPIRYDGQEPLQIGDPVLFRHAKAGELCERFNQLHLLRHGKVVQVVPTYRGLGQCFL